jgi:hypothetical protein
MAKRWLLRFLAGILTASLCSIIITTVLNQTILNSHYLESRIAAINGYNQLSTDISNEVANQAGLANIPGASTALQGIISPDVMQQKVNGALDGLQSYYQGKGSAPTINFNDITSQAQAAGVPLGQSSDLFQPVTLGPQSSGTSHPVLDLQSIRNTTLLTSVVLAVVVGLLSWKWRRYVALPNVAISVGVCMALIAVLIYLVPGNLSHYLTFSSGSYVFATLARDLIQNIARDLAHRFGLIAAICVGAGIVGRMVAVRLQTKVSDNAVLAEARAFVAARKKST